MPSKQSEIEKMVVEKRTEILLQIKLVDEATARKWLGAANKYAEDREVVEHFADEVRRLKE